jgi:hypothetical protein
LLPDEYSPQEYRGRPVSHLDLLNSFNKAYFLASTFS